MLKIIDNALFKNNIILLTVFICFCLTGCGKKPSVHDSGAYKTGKRIPGTQRPYTINGKKYYPIPSAQGFVEEGYASWYGPGFHGKMTSCGETYNMHDITAAHKILPMQTMVKVSNLDNGRELVCRINDRGPFVRDRIIDLSYASAQRLGVIGTGLARVRVEAMAEGQEQPDTTIRYTSVPDYQKGQFYIQLGSFTQYDNAYKFKERLANRFKDVVILQFEKNGQIFHRVQVFAANNYDEAKIMLMQLELEFPDSFIMAR